MTVNICAGQGRSGFQGHKEAARKEGAGNRAAWNSLFMRPDTVSAAIAAHYGVSKAELLDRDAAGDRTGSRHIDLLKIAWPVPVGQLLLQMLLLPWLRAQLCGVA